MEVRKWEDLETDCLVKVFEKVELKSLLYSVVYVCKSWHRVTLFPDCWKFLNFRELERDICCLFLPCFLLEEYMTTLIKIVVRRSHGNAVRVELPRHCMSKALDYISDGCPNLKALRLPSSVIREHEGRISELIGNLKNLEMLHLGNTTEPLFKEILTEVNINCRNFVALEAIVYTVDAEDSVALIPNIKHLVLKGSYLNPEDLMLILGSCRKLELLDVRGCAGFKVENEILKMAAHVKSFISQGGDIDGCEDEDEDCDDSDYSSTYDYEVISDRYDSD